MTYETSHLLISWGGGVFSGEGQEKKLLCKGGGGHYMTNKNIGGVFCQLNLISKKGLMQKCAKMPNAKMQKMQKNIKHRSFRSLGILQNSYFWSI